MHFPAFLSLDDTGLEYRIHDYYLSQDSSLSSVDYFDRDARYDGDIAEFLKSADSDVKLDVLYRADKELNSEEEIKAYLDEISKGVIENKDIFTNMEDNWARFIIRLYKPDKFEDYNREDFMEDIGAGIKITNDYYFDAETMYGYIVLEAFHGEWQEVDYIFDYVIK